MLASCCDEVIDFIEYLRLKEEKELDELMDHGIEENMEALKELAKCRFQKVRLFNLTQVLSVILFCCFILEFEWFIVLFNTI